MTPTAPRRSAPEPARPAGFGTDARRRAIVGIMKLVLPLAGLALLSSVFLLSERVDPERALPFASVDVEALAREPRIETPRFAAMTADGAAISVTAGSVRSDGGAGRIFTASSLRVTIETPDGALNRVQAESGVIDRIRGEVDLTGNVRLDSAAGYAIASDRLTGRLDRTLLTSPGPVSARAPGTTISADGMELRHAGPGTTGRAENYALVFTGSVRLLYEPEPLE